MESDMIFCTHYIARRQWRYTRANQLNLYHAFTVYGISRNWMHTINKGCHLNDVQSWRRIKEERNSLTPFVRLPQGRLSSISVQLGYFCNKCIGYLDSRFVFCFIICLADLPTVSSAEMALTLCSSRLCDLIGSTGNHPNMNAYQLALAFSKSWHYICCVFKAKLHFKIFF